MAKLMILGAGTYQIPAIRTAQALGHTVVALSIHADDPGGAVADVFHNVSTADREAVLAVARDERIDGVMTIASEIAAPTVAHVAEALGLPGIAPATAETVTNKFRLRSALAEHDLAGVRFREVKSGAEVAAFLADTGAPLMIKPMSLSGSRGVDRVSAPEEAERAYADCAEVAAGRSGVFVEEFVAGEDLGGECLVRDGEFLFFQVTQKIVNCHYVPIAHLTPPDLAQNDLGRCEQLVRRVVAALGVRDGVLDFDLRLGPRGPVLIELGGRLGGNCVPQVLHAASGVDLIAEGVRCALGEPAAVLPRPAAGIFTARILGSLRPGRVSGAVDPADLVPPADIVDAVLDVGAGDRAEIFDNGANRLGHVIFRSDDPDAARERVALLEQVFTVEPT
jgi:biotin carboxylase